MGAGLGFGLSALTLGHALGFGLWGARAASRVHIPGFKTLRGLGILAFRASFGLLVEGGV